MPAAPSRGPTRTAWPVSSAHGPLHRLLLCFPREAVMRRGYRRVYVDLFAKLPAATQLTVLVHPSVEEELRALVHVDTVALVAQATGAQVRRSSLTFHGGDVLTADRFVLVGRTVTDRFRQLLDPGHRVYAVGTDRPLPGCRVRTLQVRGREVVKILPGGAQSPHPLIHLDDVAAQLADDEVWLPTYGHGPWAELVTTDEANRRIWEQLGFTVTELTSFHTFAQRFGALHCITKDLDRSPVIGRCWR